MNKPKTEPTGAAAREPPAPGAAIHEFSAPIKKGAHRPPANAPLAVLPKYRHARVDLLVPYARNARVHTAAQLKAIVASIKEFGFTNPVLVDGRRGIIAGHGRVLAARELGMEVVPVIELSHLSAAQKRAYVLADNKLAEVASWDEELLILELGDLREGGFDLGLIGFDSRELTTLFGEGDDGPKALTRAPRPKCSKCGRPMPAN